MLNIATNLEHDMHSLRSMPLITYKPHLGACDLAPVPAVQARGDASRLVAADGQQAAAVCSPAGIHH